MIVDSVRMAVPPADTLAAVFAALREELGLTAAFPPEVEDEAAQAIATVELPAGDLTTIPFVTIDPEGSTDLDQALHLERAGDGYLAWYAIADVPAFVAPGGAIDAEACRRGQTMYAPDGRIPLHPPIISEGAASLLPGQVRSAYVWSFELDAAAKVTAVNVARARIRSREQLSYSGVQAELDAGTAAEPLRLLKEIGEKRVALERERGGASLSRPDQEVERDGDGYTLVRRMALPVENWNAQISLMTGMAAARLMLDGGIGILRTMPAPDAETIERFRLQTRALGTAWPEGMPYGEYLRSLDSGEPKQLAIVHAAGSLFRGAGYTVIDGRVTGMPPADLMQAAVAAPYAHTTAPLRRLVDRFVLVICAALSAGDEVPAWAREALPGLPAIMAASDGLASRLARGSIDAVEAALLQHRVGEVFEVTVISVRKGGGVVQLTDPAVTADCEGGLTAGARIRATLVSADPITKAVLLKA